MRGRTSAVTATCAQPSYRAANSTLLLRRWIIFWFIFLLHCFISASNFGNAYFGCRRYVSVLQLYGLRLTLRRGRRNSRTGDQLRSESDCATGEIHLPYPILKAGLPDGNGVLAGWSVHRGRSIPDEILVDINVSPDRRRADS